MKDSQQALSWGRFHMGYLGMSRYAGRRDAINLNWTSMIYY